jgi:hypothetical protein
MEDGPPYEVYEHPSHGLGLRTTRSLPAGSLLLTDEPLIHIPKQLAGNAMLREIIRASLGDMSEQEKRSVLKLGNCYSGKVDEGYSADEAPVKMDPLSGTFLTNCLETDDTRLAVFATASVRPLSQFDLLLC